MVVNNIGVYLQAIFFKLVYNAWTEKTPKMKTVKEFWISQLSYHRQNLAKVCLRFFFDMLSNTRRRSRTPRSVFGVFLLIGYLNNKRAEKKWKSEWLNHILSAFDIRYMKERFYIQGSGYLQDKHYTSRRTGLKKERSIYMFCCPRNVLKTLWVRTEVVKKENCVSSLISRRQRLIIHSFSRTDIKKHFLRWLIV